MISISEVNKYIINITIINWIIIRVMMTAILCGKRIEVFNLSSNFYTFYIINKRYVTSL